MMYQVRTGGKASAQPKSAAGQTRPSTAVGPHACFTPMNNEQTFATAITLSLSDAGKPCEAHPAFWAPFVLVGEERFADRNCTQNNTKIVFLKDSTNKILLFTTYQPIFVATPLGSRQRSEMKPATIPI
jgi:hypothetical protein